MQNNLQYKEACTFSQSSTFFFSKRNSVTILLHEQNKKKKKKSCKKTAHQNLNYVSHQNLYANKLSHDYGEI